MYSEKQVTKEDTWRPAELRRYIREKGHEEDDSRRKGDSEKKRHGGESIERRHRDLEESRQDREKFRERERTRDTRNEDKKERHAERRKEDSQDRRGEKERDRRDERNRDRRRLADDDREHRERRRLADDDREHRERRREKEEKYVRERDTDRHKDREKERVRERERHLEDDRDRRRPDVDKERRREERDREHRRERRQYEESGVKRRDHEDEHRDQRDRRRRSDYEGTRREKETEERHGYRKHSEQQEDRDYKEEHRRHKEERERKSKERGHHDGKQKHESRKHQDMNTLSEEVRHSHSDRDRGGKDKHREGQKTEEHEAERRHKERRHRDEDDVKKNHRDPSSKKSSSDKSDRHKKKDAESEAVNQEDFAEQEYEDDFEDYEEDFEEMDESADEGEGYKEPLDPEAGGDGKILTVQQRREIEAIQRAMAEENERVGTAQCRQNVSREEEERPTWSKVSDGSQSKGSLCGKFMDFVAAKQREVSMKVATKQKKRGADLLRLIDLDFSVTFSLLDLPPVSEYEMYIRNFGNANTKQAYVQCNEDNADRDVQTEETEMCEKWTQHPPQHSGACGDPNLSQGARDKTRSDINFDSQRLTSFLRTASQVMIVLLEEDQAERKSLRELNTQTESLTFSSGSLQLNTKLAFLYGRQISMIHFSKVQRHTMLSVHKPTTKASAVRLDSYTIICIWNIWEPSRPQKILLYESEVQCCCFSPGKATLVFAGTSVGSVVLWDLREHASNHNNMKIGDNEWTFRHPTFSTDAVMATSSHFSSVTSVEVVPSTAAGGLRPGAPLLASEEESSGLSFQLASLDESGVLNFWVVVELPKVNEAGSMTDLGLRPGGKVKLLHSSSLLAGERVSSRDAMKTGPLRTQLLKFLPSDSNHFFIGTNMGLVNHGTSHGLKPLPKFYRFQETEMMPVDVSSIDFSPFSPHLFLVGCGDGSIRLHAVSHEQPVAEWRSSTAGEPVVSLQWAQTRMTVFCVLDAASNLHIWDLLKNDAQPEVTERLSPDRITTMAVFGDSGQQSTYSGIAVAHESGKIELQYFKSSFTVSSSAEEGKLESFLTEAF